MAIYDKFAKQYSASMLEEGDYFHKTQIDPYIYKTVGKLEGKTVYDIGCGNGYMARHFTKMGANVYASDASSLLVEEAKQKSEGLNITYSVRDALNFDGFEKEVFDVVTMNMVIHYIKDLDKLFAGISDVLKDRGIFAFSTNHFFRPDHPRSEWVAGKIDNKETLFIKVTGYLKTEKRVVTSGWDNKTKMALYNHPLNELVNTMSKYSLYTFKVEEPESVGFAKSFSEELQKSHHIPTFMTIGARKCG
jgi:2-polyprenyl-3-methyl-5-hydroxy-6-metoxy-1,4-benzoquinol methylase